MFLCFCLFWGGSVVLFCGIDWSTFTIPRGHYYGHETIILFLLLLPNQSHPCLQPSFIIQATIDPEYLCMPPCTESSTSQPERSWCCASVNTQSYVISLYFTSWHSLHISKHPKSFNFLVPFGRLICPGATPNLVPLYLYSYAYIFLFTFNFCWCVSMVYVCTSVFMGVCAWKGPKCILLDPVALPISSLWKYLMH